MAPTARSSNNGPAPRTIEELQALSIAISRGDTDLHLGPRAREVLSQLIELRGDQSLLSISSLARRLNVNPSTISRLARTLGYERFGELQSLLLSSGLTPARSFYRQHATTALAADKQDLQAQARQLCGEHQLNIERFMEGLTNEDLGAFAKAVMGARRVRLHGMRQFHAFASFLAYGLGMIRSDVGLLSDDNVGVAEGLASMAAGDVLITASCKPYTRHVIDVCRAAHDNGIRTIVVTDYSSSPLVRHSEIAILAPHESSFISNSMVTFLGAAECLVNACATVGGDGAAEALSRRDKLIDQLDIEIG
ncbi:MurR/RpiR family transcriptional regulator [Halomonas alkalisoli]|uniref:MurR/RpiR family transcriptional regulator n=1 Tax=Halomonas alkalisoli TaxID=2907158 RepID=UPI001F315868|nr:MurR/RpiR family transcriptional regulator [Halomonas alkalisoli]MCE9683637.1 MurR/RpiR family transcriptional regulator [Halomonas alkalisoli]